MTVTLGGGATLAGREVDATNKLALLQLGGVDLSRIPPDDLKPRLFLQISTEPGIGLVWLGMALGLAGGLLALLRRRSEARASRRQRFGAAWIIAAAPGARRPGARNTMNAYELLGIGRTASRAELDAVYAARHAAYDPSRLTGMGEELVARAAMRRAELDTAYRLLRPALMASRQLAGTPSGVATARRSRRCSCWPHWRWRWCCCARLHTRRWL